MKILCTRGDGSQLYTHHFNCVRVVAVYSNVYYAVAYGVSPDNALHAMRACTKWGTENIKHHSQRLLFQPNGVLHGAVTLQEVVNLCQSMAVTEVTRQPFTVFRGVFNCRPRDVVTWCSVAPASGVLEQTSQEPTATRVD